MQNLPVKNIWQSRASTLRFYRICKASLTHYKQRALEIKAVTPLTDESGYVQSPLMNTDIQKLTQDYRVALEAQRDELKEQLDRIEQLLALIQNPPFNQGNGVHDIRTSTSHLEQAGGDAGVSGKEVTYRSGLPEGLTRRQIVQQIIDELDKDTFVPLDIRERYIKRYPQANTKTLASAISTLLRKMAEKGEIQRLGREGDSPTDPYVYQKVNNSERLDMDP